MLDKRVIFAIHNYANQGYAKAKIAELLCLDRKTVVKYLQIGRASCRERV